MKSPKTIIFFIFFIVLAAGAFSVFAMKNTFVVENSNAASYEPVVYLTGADLKNNPEEVVAPQTASSSIRVLPNSVGYLNVRADATTSSSKIGQVDPGDEFAYTETKDNWYRIILPSEETGWVSGQYVEEVKEQG